MPFKSCQKCGRIFALIRSPFCGACLEIIDREYRLIRRHIDEHPQATVADTACDLQIDERTILYLLREGRLETRQKVLWPCSGCGQPIQTGDYCPACLSRLSIGFMKPSEQPGPGRLPHPQRLKAAAAPQADSRPLRDSDQGMHVRTNQAGGNR